MQSYSHPDLFFCPLYNRPGISDPKMSLCGSEDDSETNQDSELYWASSPPSSTSSSCSSSPTSPSSSTVSSPTSSRSTSRSSSPSPGSDGTRERKVHKFKRMSAKAGKSLLDFATEVESRRIVHTKRQQVKASQISRNMAGEP